MNEIEVKMMQGMVSILNEATLTKEQYDSRIEDLKQFEQETHFALLNSPTQNVDLKSIVVENEVFNPKFEKTNNPNDIIEEFNKEELIIHASFNGVNTLLTYKDGVIMQAETNSVEYLKQVDNLPYKIDRMGLYGVYGKMVFVDGKLKFFVDEVIDDIDNNVNNGFERAKELGFDIVPNWFATNLNPKALQSTVNYIFDYMKEEGFPYDGIMFRTNDCMHQRILKLVEGSN